MNIIIKYNYGKLDVSIYLLYFMVNQPYGGKLKLSINYKTDEEVREEYGHKYSIVPFTDFLYDSLKIADGSYSPLEGFMGEDELKSVIQKEQLMNDLPWTIPIFLAIGEKENENMKVGDDVVLSDPSGKSYGLINVESKFKLDRKEIAQSVYGTTDLKHPNVNDIFTNYGRYAISGKVKVFRDLKLPGNKYEIHPQDARDLFAKRGWNSIAAYQARNPPHVAHEYLQKVSLELPEVDGLFIHLAVGRLKKGDYKVEAILDSYEAFIKNYHRPENVTLSTLSITMRYAGPKAAIFLAIIRRNFGATHYIVGRDQAGVAGLYDPYAAHKKFDEMDIGIIPLKFRDTYYCKKCAGITSESVCPHSMEDRMIISQTKIREMLKTGQKIPEEIMRPEVAKVLGKGNVIND